MASQHIIVAIAAPIEAYFAAFCLSASGRIHAKVCTHPIGTLTEALDKRHPKADRLLRKTLWVSIAVKSGPEEPGVHAADAFYDRAGSITKAEGQRASPSLTSQKTASFSLGLCARSQPNPPHPVSSTFIAATFDKMSPLAYTVAAASGVIRETGSGNLPLETVRCLGHKGRCAEERSSEQKSPRDFRRLMKAGGFFLCSWCVIHSPPTNEHP
jgi:hypothetical protein